MKGIAASLALALSLALPSGAEYFYSPEYTQAAQAILARHYVDARALADLMLDEDPESFEAHALLGQVHLWGEEDLGLADHHLRQARSLIERRFPSLDSEGAPQALHKEILRNLRQATLLREQYEDSLQVIADYNALYEPDLDHLSGWPLLKLGRFAEAQAAVEAALARRGEDDPQRVDLQDTLGQLAYEQRKLDEAEKGFLAASILETDTADQPDPVYLTNLGEVYRDRLRFEEAEATWLEATQWAHPGSYAAPRQRLACLYAGQGRFEEAFDQLQQSLSWRAALWPQVAAHSRASHLTAVGEVLLGFGDSQRAVDVLARALRFPNRQALSSGRTEIALAKRHLLYAAAMDLRTRQLEEIASWSRGRAWWKARRAALEGQLASTLARAQAAVVLARGTDVETTTLPYGPGTLDCPWLLPQLADGLGSGVSSEALALQRGNSIAQAIQPYLSLLGPWAAQDSLPESEALARAIVLARARSWAEALALDPAVARRLDLSIGLDVLGPPDVVSTLHASPRFHDGNELTLAVHPNLSATLSDAKGRELARLPSSPDAAGLAAELHRVLFSRDALKSAREMDSLTREASPGRLSSDRLKQMLGDPP